MSESESERARIGATDLDKAHAHVCHAEYAMAEAYLKMLDSVDVVDDKELADAVAILGEFQKLKVRLFALLSIVDSAASIHK